jgi:hypothetical protein
VSANSAAETLPDGVALALLGELGAAEFVGAELGGAPASKSGCALLSAELTDALAEGPVAIVTLGFGETLVDATLVAASVLALGALVALKVAELLNALGSPVFTNDAMSGCGVVCVQPPAVTRASATRKTLRVR